MIEKEGQVLVLENRAIRMKVRLDDGIHCETLTHLGQGTAVNYGPETGKFFRFSTRRGEIDHFCVERVDILQDETEQLVSVYASCEEQSLHVRLSLILEGNDVLRILLQSASDRECPEELWVCCPFLANLTLPDPQERRYYPNNSLFRAHPLFTFPYVLTDHNDRYGFSVAFPTLSEIAPAVQNRNVDLKKISSRKELENHRMPLRLGRVLSDTFELEISALAEGWREAFAQYRRQQRSRFDLCAYSRPDLQWMRHTVLHHFTYLYSKESWDEKNGQAAMDKLLKDGEAFGGYDTLTLWHQYPRLGVDSRTQWDFFDDFPGGRDGLRSIADAAHQKGVKVFLPYKPWDIGNDQSMNETSDQVRQLVVDTGIDGFFLDTMDSVPATFRPALDSVKPGVVFCSEVHPSTCSAVEDITSSWGKSKASDPIERLDYMRFLLPEHPAPIISRWATGEGKTRLIERAIFSGTGLVIWQDVFGAWLPYSVPQKERIKKYKKIWLDNQEIFLGMHPTPLYPTLHSTVLCNRFDADDGSASIFTFCNTTDQVFTGDLLALQDIQGMLTLLGQEFSWNGAVLNGTVSPDAVSMVRIDWKNGGN